MCRMDRGTSDDDTSVDGDKVDNGDLCRACAELCGQRWHGEKCANDTKMDMAGSNCVNFD